MSQNEVVHSPPAVGGVTDLVMACIMLFDVTLPITMPVAAAAAPDADAPRQGHGGMVKYLLQFAAKPWYPWVVGALSGLNNFTMVLSVPLVVLYMSGVLANPPRRRVAAFANAVGTTAGVAVLVYLFIQNDEYIKESFPSVFDHPTWAKTEWAVSHYGWFGAFLISVMPVFLQPLVVICCLAKMSKLVLLGCVLTGRTLKYIIMAELAVAGDKRLGFFGSAALNAAESFEQKDK
jgi:membrane protein YqaA with SNARE-associated domain